MVVGFSKILIASIVCLSGLIADWPDMLSGQSRLQNWFPDRLLRDISWSMAYRGISALRVVSQNRLLVSYLALPAFPKPARVGSPCLDGDTRHVATVLPSDGPGRHYVNGQSTLQRYRPSPN